MSDLTKTGRRLTMIGGLCSYPLPHTPIPDTSAGTVIRGAPVLRTYGGSVRPSATETNGAGDRSN